MRISGIAVLLASVAFLGAGCERPIPPSVEWMTGPDVVEDPAAGDVSASRPVGFDVPFAIVPNETVSVGDELDVTLEVITDSRCKPDAVCVWAGELGARLMVTVRNGGESEEVTLGQTTAPKKNVYLREFTLVSASEGSVELSVASVPVAETQAPDEE